MTIQKFLLSSPNDYINFLLDALNYYSSPEEVEEYFGVLFGTEDQRANGINDTSKISIIDAELWPQHYPCVMLHCYDESDYRGADLTVKICEYIYQKDFSK